MLWKQSYARGKPTTQADQCRAGAQPPRHLDPLQAGPDGVRRHRVQPGAAVSAVPLQGLPVPRRADPLGLRSVAAARRQGRHAGRGGAALPGRPARQPGRRRSASSAVVLPQPWAGEADLPGRRRPGWNGRSPGWSEGEGFLHSYCNTIPTTQGGTHEAGFRAALLKGLRAWGEQRGNRRAAQVVRRGPARADRGQAVGVPARAAVPGPDQGEAHQQRGHAPGGDRAARPVRPLAGRRSDAGRQPARLRHRAGGGAAAPAREQGHRAQVRHAAAAAARQAHRLHAGERRGDRDLPGRGRFAPAARPSRRATARPRRCCRCAARS